MFDRRLIRAEILKLRRRRGLIIATGFFTFLVVAIFYAIASILHAGHPETNPPVGGLEGFSDLVGLLTLTGAVAGVIVGATAGGADIEAGVFRDLAATGRSRTALFLARVPGAWAIVVPGVASGLALGTALALVLDAEMPLTAAEFGEGVASVLVATMLLSAISVGLATLTGSRGMIIGVVLTFQLGLSPILAQIEALGEVRYALPAVANARIGGDIADELSLAVAILIVLAWAAATLGAGLWRARTQEI
jgi:ABC-type transport system involved in multi-copper enzyme maturation permease subunit